ncbi:MAG: InlB B-repeat-containing protein, partial [Clostridia bacterium]|nr:InlB B-repeat-containing protein [Clostridia bacterium]
WVDGEGNEPVAVTGNATYTATFIQVINQYKIKISFENNVNQNIDPEVTIKINGQDVDVYEITSNGILFDYGTEISLVALIQGKYNLSWTENGREATRINNLQMDNFQLKKDEEFTLYISQIFTISVVYDDTMGSVDKGESVSVLRGDDVKMTASANNGYKFVTWVKGEGSYYNAQNLNKAQVTILGVSGNCEITAEFEIVVYKIRIFVDGVLTEMDYTITSQAVALPTPSKDGYKFLGWTGSNGSKPEKNITIASGSFGDKVFYAEFTKPEGNEKLIIILAVAAAVVVTGVIITIIVIAKNKRGRRRRRPITIDLSRFK